MSARGEAIYLYGFMRPHAPVALRRSGVSENAVPVASCHGGLVALTSRVARNDFTGSHGAAHLQDPAWVGPRAFRHQAVLEEAMALGVVYPLPFGTLFSSAESLERTISTRRSEIEAVLERVADCREWGVVGTLDRDAALDALLRERVATGAVILPEAPGRRHLEIRRLRRKWSPALHSWLEPRIEALWTELGRWARETARRRPPTDDAGLFNWAFLVPLPVTGGFRESVAEAVRHLEETGLALRCTGPWPPYSFRGKAP